MYFSSRTGQTALPTHRQYRVTLCYPCEIHSIEEQPRMYVLSKRVGFKENRGRSMLIFFKIYQSVIHFTSHGGVWKEMWPEVTIHTDPWQWPVAWPSSQEYRKKRTRRLEAKSRDMWQIIGNRHWVWGFLIHLLMPAASIWHKCRTK